jgi:hypothetical protein
MCGAAFLWMMSLLLVVSILGPILSRGLSIVTTPDAGRIGLPIILLLAFFAILPLLAISVFVRTCHNGLLRRAVPSLSFEGALDLARIGQTREPVPRWGEGVLEAFDFAG